MSLPSSALLRRVIGIDRRGERLGVRLRRQPVERHLHEVGIAEEARAIEIAATHRFDLVVKRLRRQRAELRQIEVLENVEHLDHRTPPLLGGGMRDQLVAVILAAHRRAHLRLVLREVLLAR